MRIKAFTLAETLIVIAIIGILATITMTVLTGSMPDKKKAMFKKAYSVIERTVGEAVNDETLYPFKRDAIGFLNFAKADMLGLIDDASDDVGSDDGNVTLQKEKFCKIFSNKLNTVGVPANPCEFETTDGIAWQIPAGNFVDANEIKVRVDINGDRDPNFNTFPMTAESCSDGENIFCINVRFDGKISVEEDSIEAEMLRSQTIKKEERQNNN